MGKDNENIIISSKDHWKNYYVSMITNLQKLLKKSDLFTFSTKEVAEMEAAILELKDSVTQLKNNKGDDDEFQKALDAAEL